MHHPSGYGGGSAPASSAGVRSACRDPQVEAGLLPAGNTTSAGQGRRYWLESGWESGVAADATAAALSAPSSVTRKNVVNGAETSSRSAIAAVINSRVRVDDGSVASSAAALVAPLVVLWPALDGSVASIPGAECVGEWPPDGGRAGFVMTPYLVTCGAEDRVPRVVRRGVAWHRCRERRCGRLPTRRRRGSPYRVACARVVRSMVWDGWTDHVARGALRAAGGRMAITQEMA